MKFFRAFIIFCFLFSWYPALPNVIAQSEPPKLPIYIVQPGDSLNLIALKFNVSAQDIVAVNSLPDPNILQVNTQLVIPGITGAEGLLSFEPIKFGETPLQIARRYNLPLNSLYKLNRITTPSEFFLGANIILVNEESESSKRQLYKMQAGETLLEAAIKQDQSPWQITFENQNSYPWQVIPNEQIVTIKQNADAVSDDTISIDKLPLKQGKTSSIYIREEVTNPSASLDGMGIDFYNFEDQSIAIFGVHALKDPGLYPFHLEYQNTSGENISVDQLILVQSGFYPKDPPLSVDPATLDDASNQKEEDIVNQIYSRHSEIKLWDDVFQWPTDDPCIKSGFGNRRSYNGSPYDRYHTGLDLGVCLNFNVYAPADGIVVFSGPLDIRGNATIIDHGFGVFSGFWHQSKTFVETGQQVKVHDLIGEIGNTGRSTGPHLHWEMIANGISVNPIDWLETTFP